RLQVIVPEAENGGYHGIRTGSGLGADSEDDYSKGFGGFYTSPDSPTYFFTYSEVKFIEAEAKFRKGDKSGAYNAFIEGVKGDLDKLNINGSEQSDYIDAINQNIGPDNLSLSHIMVQKYISLMLDPETWVDFRRMDYSSDIYPGLKRPKNVNESIFPNPDDW